MIRSRLYRMSTELAASATCKTSSASVETCRRQHELPNEQTPLPPLRRTRPQGPCGLPAIADAHGSRCSGSAECRTNWTLQASAGRSEPAGRKSPAHPVRVRPHQSARRAAWRCERPPQNAKRAPAASAPRNTGTGTRYSEARPQKSFLSRARLIASSVRLPIRAAVSSAAYGTTVMGAAADVGGYHAT
jgi:hypothetical protein